MTIKKRLFVSNILMILIPAVLAVVAAAAGILLLLSLIMPDFGYRLSSQHELGETRQAIVETAEEWLAEDDPDRKITLGERMDRAGRQNSMFVTISRSGTAIASFGDGAGFNQEDLKAALEALGEAALCPADQLSFLEAGLRLTAIYIRWKFTIR